tara:strand:- start:2350 stop:2946 length:597 start_codon:yes stop_codon:yes gene_type:complete
MIKSPIQKVTENLQNRAIGIIYGSYKPISQDSLNKGYIKDDNNFALDAVVLGKTLPLIKKYIDFDKKYFFIVYPRNKNSDGLHLQIAGIWDPNNLNKGKKDLSQNPHEILKNFDLKDNYFSIRGKLIFIKIPEKEVIVKITPLITTNSNKSKAFKLILKGELPLNLINSFLSIDALREGNSLRMENFEVIENKSIIIN